MVGTHFVRSGLLPPAMGRLISRMQRDREDADYAPADVTAKRRQELSVRFRSQWSPAMTVGSPTRTSPAAGATTPGLRSLTWLPARGAAVPRTSSARARSRERPAGQGL
jgi:hypothetical protein